MKKFMLGLACISLLIGTLGTGMKADAAFGRSYTAPKGTPVLDGEVDEVWNTAKWTNVDKVHDDARDGVANCRVKVIWDETGLHFLAEVYDITLNKRNDLVEVYLDQNGDKTRDFGDDDTHTRFYVRQEGVVTSSACGQNAQLEALSAVKDCGDNVYRVEGTLSWMVGTPKAGDVMGLEFMLHDGSEFKTKEEAYRWNCDSASGDEPAFSSTVSWGELILADAGTALDPETYVDGEKKQENLADGATQTPDADTNAATDDDATDDTKTTGADTNAEKDGAGLGLWIGVGAVAVVIIVIVVVLATRKKKAE